jgi:hypothetical protein
LIYNTSSFWNTDLKSKSALQNLKYSALPFQLETQLIKLTRQSAFNKDIVVITDGLGMNPTENRNKKKILILLFLKLSKKKTISLSIVFQFKKTVENFIKSTLN